MHATRVAEHHCLLALLVAGSIYIRRELIEEEQNEEEAGNYTKK
jgi:hypothetical protein